MGDPEGGFFDSLWSFVEGLFGAGLEEVSDNVGDILVDIFETIAEQDGNEEMIS